MIVSPVTVLMVPRMGGVLGGAAGIWAGVWATANSERQIVNLNPRCTMTLFPFMHNLPIEQLLGSWLLARAQAGLDTRRKCGWACHLDAADYAARFKQVGGSLLRAGLCTRKC